MKYCYLLLILLLVGGLLGPPTFGQDAGPTAGPQTPATQPSDRLGLYIQAIQEAADPSAAVAAYARGVALEPASQQLLAAYVHRMVQLNLPEAAYHQARMLVDLDPNDGTAWAVLSFVAARQGRMAEALADGVQAASREPDSPFVQQTMGELLAWYDLNKPTVSSSLSDSLERIRQDLANQRAFAEAYADASGQLKREGAGRRGPQTQPTTRPAPQGQAEAVPPESYGEPRPELVYPDINYTMPPGYSSFYPAYPTEIYYPSLAYNAPYVAPDWWWWNSWWPYGPYGPYGPFFTNRFFGQRQVFHQAPDLWRLDRGGLSLLFQRHDDKFTLLGVDRSGLTNGVSRERGSVTRGSQDISRNLTSLSEQSQSRIFAPGREPARLSFGRQGTAGDQALLRQGPSVPTGGPVNIQRSLAAPVDALRPTTISPNVIGGGRSDVSRSLSFGQPQTTGNNIARQLSGPAIPVPRSSTPSPTVINPQVERSGSLSPRVSTPSTPQFGGASPRMDVSRSAAPPPSGGGSRGGAGGISRGFSGGGGASRGGDISRGGGGGGGGRGGGGRR